MRVPGIIRNRPITAGIAIAVLGAAGVLQFVGVNPAASQNATLTAFEASSDPGTDPASGAWKQAPQLQLPLSVQGASYATGGGSIAAVGAQALHFQDRVYIRLEWADPTKDETTTRVQDFSDAAAIEFPSKSTTSVPSICMGQAGAGVNIWQWRADSQAGIKDPADVYTNSLVDAYPSKEDIFYTARAAGNPYADPKQGPTQTLIAQAFGTLAKANIQDVKGQGSYANGKWTVVFERQLAGGDNDQATFTMGKPTDMAIAVWNGSDGDRNGRKSVSSFLKLSLMGGSLATEESNPMGWVVAGVLLVGLAGLGVGLGWYGYRDARRSG